MLLVIIRLIPEESVQNNGDGAGFKEKQEDDNFYPWSCNSLFFKRGQALIFSDLQPESELVAGFKQALEFLEYSPTIKSLMETDSTLHNSNNIHLY